jgi:hypothetical protein
MARRALRWPSSGTEEMMTFNSLFLREVQGSWGDQIRCDAGAPGRASHAPRTDKVCDGRCCERQKLGHIRHFEGVRPTPT